MSAFVPGWPISPPADRVTVVPAIMVVREASVPSSRIDPVPNAEIDTALGLFVQDGNVGKFARVVATKYAETR